MKVFFTIIICCVFSRICAQDNIKPHTLGIHYSLTDFETCSKIQASSVHNVLKNHQWSKPSQMMTGIGIDYLKGLTNHIDFVAGFNYTKGINNYKLPISNTINYTLLTLDATVNIKLLNDKYYMRPYLLAGAGIYVQNGVGFYAPVGGGLQFNIFNAALVNIQTQFRAPFSKKDYGNFYYQFGIATAISKKKKQQTLATPPVVQQEIKQQPIPEEPSKIYKPIAVKVIDEATGLPLPNVSVHITGEDNVDLTESTSQNGQVIFSHIEEGNYSLNGILNKIPTSSITISKENFKVDATELLITLTHNDPRFTLSGQVVEKRSNSPAGNTLVTISNKTSGNTYSVTNNNIDGSFSTQLESGSDFSISGKRENYLSNIENISTKGLNRTTTLYVKLQLAIEEVKAGENIVLNKIFFETGKSILNIQSSSDLDKLILFLKDNPAAKLEIQGYTDNTGSLAVNNALSKNRAQSVMNYLIKNGIDKNRLQIKGFGPLKPIADNKTADGRAQNRRVEMQMLK